MAGGGGGGLSPSYAWSQSLAPIVRGGVQFFLKRKGGLEGKIFEKVYFARYKGVTEAHIGPIKK